MNCLKGDQPRCRRTETTFSIKRLKVRLKIDMKPTGTFLSSQCYCLLDKTSCDTEPTVVGMNACIENERVGSTVPSDINKPDNSIAIIDTYMAETA